MIALSRTSIYAVRALSCLPDRETRTSLIGDLAAETKIPKPYLAKIINRLVRYGLIYAKRGYRGGIALTRPSHEVSMLEIVRAIEGENWITHCLLELDCSLLPGHCPTAKAWTGVRKEIEEILRTTTLAEVMAFTKFSKIAEGAGCACKHKPAGDSPVIPALAETGD